MFFDGRTISAAVNQLKGSANQLIKIWFTLKLMGLSESTSVCVNTSNSTPFLKTLFSCGDEEERFFVPFARQKRFSFMKKDAARSIIQTTIQRWASSDSVVTCSPKQFLDFETSDSGELRVKVGRRYPLGLGHGPNGFADDEGTSVAIPALAFAVWFFRNSPLHSTSPQELVLAMKEALHISPAESRAVFVEHELELSFQESALTDFELFSICDSSSNREIELTEREETEQQYQKRIKSVMSITDKPSWMKLSPSLILNQLVKSGEKFIVLEGPPRTGKTRAIDKLTPRTDEKRATIQLHEGWGYENLVQGLFPADQGSSFSWRDGAIMLAIKQDKKIIVLEEINRTRLSQALGELFSLLESSYRGKENSIQLPSGETIFIPEDVLFIASYNSLDSSTEDIDDAFIGRVASVHFPPRVEDLIEILDSKLIPEREAEKIGEVFNAILQFYPLGHGYFSGLKQGEDFRFYYLSRIRPVLTNHFGKDNDERVQQIDALVDNLFQH